MERLDNFTIEPDAEPHLHVGEKWVAPQTKAQPEVSALEGQSVAKVPEAPQEVK